MKYYNKNGMEVNITKTSKIDDTGCYGNIYGVFGDDNICLKELKDVAANPLSIFDDSSKVISEEIFSYFRDFNHSHFCKLYDLFYNKDGDITAYTMKYYKKAIDNILAMPVDYLIDNFSVLYDAMEVLARDLVLVVDLHNRNMILTNDNIVLVDFDKYHKEKRMDFDSILEENTCALYCAFTKMFNDALKKNGMYSAYNVLSVADLFSYGVDPLVLNRRFRGCKNIKDYFH